MRLEGIIVLNRFEDTPPNGANVAVLFADRDFFNVTIHISSNRHIQYRPVNEPDFYYPASQVLGWNLYDELTDEQKRKIGNKLPPDQWKFATEFPASAIQLEGPYSCPPNNTRSGVLLKSGLFVETMCRSDGFVMDGFMDKEDMQQIPDCGYFDSKDIIGWCVFRELNSSQRALAGLYIKKGDWEMAHL